MIVASGGMVSGVLVTNIALRGTFFAGSLPSIAQPFLSFCLPRFGLFSSTISFTS